MSIQNYERERRNTEVDRLVLLAQEGDSEAYAKIYDIHVVSIYRYIYYRVNIGDAEDLTEMVFLKAWEALRKYRKMNCSFAAWLFRIARNLIIDYYRMNKTYAELDENVADKNPEADPEARMENVLTNESLRKAVGKLKDVYQQVIILKFINNLSNTEIAEVMRRKEGNIRVLQFRALAELKCILEEMNIQFS